MFFWRLSRPVLWLLRPRDINCTAIDQSRCGSAKSRDRATEPLPVGCRATGVVYVVPGSREDPRDGRFVTVVFTDARPDRPA